MIHRTCDVVFIRLSHKIMYGTVVYCSAVLMSIVGVKVGVSIVVQMG